MTLEVWPATYGCDGPIALPVGSGRSPWRWTRRARIIEAAGKDPFRETHPTVDWTVQLSYAEEVGLGTRSYRLKTLRCSRA